MNIDWLEKEFEELGLSLKFEQLKFPLLLWVEDLTTDELISVRHALLFLRDKGENFTISSIKEVFKVSKHLIIALEGRKQQGQEVNKQHRYR
ncbi:hypothetical protein H7U07_11175 [Bacillus cereus]|uniref:hypothetical protein n=1 Tax=Bacillus cereus TaxID=1396 RepID=UPI001C8DCE33|nr:hypothetical protein [Bacillus cereus]MBY0016920.1 hypothetical protein [Bacillus cereus]